MLVVKHGLRHILFEADSLQTEFIIGNISFAVGIWLWTPSAHGYFRPGMGLNLLDSPNQPELWGIMLLLSGVLKILGTMSGVLLPRRISCFVALFVWSFLALRISEPVGAWGHFSLAILLSGILAFINFLLLLRLKAQA